MIKSALIIMTILVVSSLLIDAAASIEPDNSKFLDFHQENIVVSIITDQNPGISVEHGLKKLTDALHSKVVSYEKVNSLAEANGKLIMVAGLFTGNGIASQLIKEGAHKIPEVPEALSIWKTSWKNTPVVVICGYDDRGLMYGLLDVADQVRWNIKEDVLSDVIIDISEKPFVSERAVSIYTFHRAYWESRFYDLTYWEHYLDLLAKSRFNSLVLIFGYENDDFLAPAYPYFFDVENFPEVRMVGITPEEQLRNLDTLNHLIKMAHERNISFTVAFWDHIRGGTSRAISEHDNVNAAKSHQVEGVTASNLSAYTKAALTKFITLVPELDAIQFRMHDESGLSVAEQESLWPDIFAMIKEKAPDMRLVLRAKGLPDRVIQNALDIGVDFRIATKYWMEQMGMPYHPTHINRQNQHDRRHSYSDMLRYPQQYRMHWRLWSGGTTRILLWGDPEYVRRFTDSTHLYDGDGFEISEPLATKMQGQQHEDEPFELLNPKYRYYDYEFERYWHFFQVFGRIAYNPETSPDIWKKEFELRFGNEAAPYIETALHKASWILPRIVASCTNYFSGFPMTRGWVEKQRLGDLPSYALNEGSDIQQFANFDEEARLLIERGETAKIRPSETSLWFKQAYTEINKLITEAESKIGDKYNKEFISTVTDLKILSNLALFHSRRIPAAVSYRLFEHTKDVSALDQAILYEREAIDAWRQIVDVASDVYTENIKMGLPEISSDERLSISGLSGHWKDELNRLETGLQSLEEKRNNYVRRTEGNWTPSPSYNTVSEKSYDQIFDIEHEPVNSYPVNESLTLKVKVSSPAGVKWVRLLYRSIKQTQHFQNMPMYPTEDKDTYQAIIPADWIDPEYDFMYLIECMNHNGQGRIYPDLNYETPYVIVELIR